MTVAPGRILSAHPIFATLPAKKLGQIVAGAHIRRFRLGDYLWRAGENVTCFCVVVEGLLQTVIVRPSGKCSVIELFKEGDVCGCLTYLREKGALCDLRAAADAVVICVSVGEAVGPRQAAPCWFEAVCRNLANRFERQIQLRAICVEPSRRKIPAALLWLHESTGSAIPLTQSVLAMVVGLTEESVCRALAPLKIKGLIYVSRGLIRVPNRSALERYLEALR